MNQLGKRVLAIKAERATCGCGKTNERRFAGGFEFFFGLDCDCDKAKIEACEPYTPESPEWLSITRAFYIDAQDRVTEATIEFIDGDEDLWGYWFVLKGAEQT